jgi:hypothetical protein
MQRDQGSDCTRKDLRSLFGSFAEDRASPEQSKMIEKHLSECSECQGEMSVILGRRLRRMELPRKSHV